MIKYLKYASKVLGMILVSPFWSRKYNKKKDKYPIQVRYNKVRSFLQKFSKRVQIEFYISGEENLPKDSNFLLVCNHQSNIDPISFIDQIETPLTFISKKEVAKFPYVGKILNSIDGIFMDRKNMRSEIKAIMQASKTLEEGKQSVMIFPEGTRSKSIEHEVLTFKAGALKPAYNSSKPIVVVCIYGAFRVLDKKLRMKKYPIQISYIKTFYPEEYKQYNTNQLNQIIQDLVETKYKELKEKDKELVKIHKLKHSKMDCNISGL
jgi:1-acyl-sn-glycerol-3-phosphate acyltransferase